MEPSENYILVFLQANSAISVYQLGGGSDFLVKSALYNHVFTSHIVSLQDAMGRKSWQQRRGQRKCLKLLEKLKKEQQHAMSTGRYPAGTVLQERVVSQLTTHIQGSTFPSQFTTFLKICSCTGIWEMFCRLQA